MKKMITLLTVLVLGLGLVFGGYTIYKNHVRGDITIEELTCNYK